MRRAGFTMIELLVILVILAFLIMAGVFAAMRMITRANDGERIAHMQKYRTAFEGYFSDHGSYPNPSVLQNCGGPGMQPYMNEILCDPLTNTPYLYLIDANATHYAMYTTLVNADDPLIATRKCQNGCGPDEDGDGQSEYNLGITDSGVITGTGTQTVTQCTFNGQTAPTCLTSGGTPFCFPGSTNCCGGSTCSPSGDSCYTSVTCEEI
jgi:type II secretory pathway pseudopilin PulG